MADEVKAPKLDGITSLFEIIFVLIFVLAVLNRIPIVLEENTGIDIFDLKGSYERLRSIHEDTPLGTRVSVFEGSEILATPGFGRILGYQDENAYGFLEAGPTAAEGGRWWFVNFDDDPDGWIAEEYLRNGTITRASRITTAVFYFFSTVLIVGLLTFVLYLTMRINQVRAREIRAMKTAVAKASAERQATSAGRNPRWLHVLESIESEKPNDWRQAIIEADIMLDEMLTSVGYQGESVGEKLKQMGRNKFATVDMAWDAHKIRNQIAHGGSNYILSQREARRAIEMYRQVFEEFSYI